jgi:hypothetical protein
MALGGDTLASKAWDKMTGKPAAPAAGGGGGTPPTPPGPTPPARNEAEIRDLTNRMTQFINHVNSPPNGAVPLSDGLSNQFISDVEAILRGPLPSPLTVPALHAAAGQDYGMIVTAAHDFATNSLSPALGILHGYHTEMDGIYALATSSNQYNNVQDTVRQQYEAAVTAFLVAETRLTDLAGFIGAL